MRRPRFEGLWRNTAFLKLWAGQSVSQIGSQVTLLALPLTAVLTLKAGAVQMGYLSAAGFAPPLLVGLFAGVWVDRLRRRPILIGADLGRALLLASIPLAAFLGVLRIEQLYLVAFLTGVLNVFFRTAYVAFLPSLVPREHLFEGNSRLATSRSTAQSLGPGLAGLLVQAFTAPVAMLADALSFVVSACSLLLIDSPEPAAPPRQRRFWREIGDGLGLVWNDILLRALAGWSGSFNFFGQLIGTLLVLYATRDLGLAPATLGAIFMVMGLSGITGSVLAAPVTSRFGQGRVLAVSAILAGGVQFLIPLAGISPVGPVAPLVVDELVFGFVVGMLNVTIPTLQQTSAPNELQGRVMATMTFAVAGTMPFGALCAGVLGSVLGLQATVALGAAGTLVAALWLLPASVRGVHPLEMGTMDVAGPAAS